MDNYPALAHGQRECAPWDEDEGMKTFTKTITVSLERDIEIESSSYWEDCDGELEYSGDPVADYSAQHYTISELLEDYVRMLQASLEAIGTPSERRPAQAVWDIKRKIKDASGWSEYITYE